MELATTTARSTASTTSSPRRSTRRRRSQRPHPRILIGGTGEKKTLRLVAKYADACNIFAHGGPDFVKQKLDVLREHCEREGRNYDEIEKTVYVIMVAGANGENAGAARRSVRAAGRDRVQTVIGAVLGVENLTPLEAIGRDVIPQVAKL